MKKVLSLVLAFVLVLGMIPTFAADAATGALNLYDNGFITGKDGATVDAKLDVNAKLTRAELAALIAELNGAKEEAAAFAQPADFKDADTFQDWAKPYIAYAQENGWMNGLGDGTMFGPTQPVPANQLVAVLMNALGYEVTWNTVLADAAELGIIADGDSLTRGEAFEAMWVAVSEVPMNTEEGLTLGVKLGKLEPTVPVVTDLVVKSVTVDNLKTMVVEFNKPVDGDTITATTVKAVKGTTNVVADRILSDDGMTLTIVYTTTAVTQSSDIKLTIDGVKSVDGTEKISEYTSTNTVTDVALPSITGAAALNAKQIEVFFSEPMNTESFSSIAYQIINDVKIDDIAVIAKVTPNFAKNSAVFELSTLMTAGTHKVAFTNLSDYAGYKALAANFDVTVVEDKTAPQLAEAVVKNINTVEVTFNESLSAQGNFWVNGNAAVATVVANSNNTKYSLAFTPALDLSAIVQIKVEYQNQKDVVGNAVSTKTAYMFTVADDTTLPTVAVTVGTGNKLTLTFSKPMLGTVGTIQVLDKNKAVKSSVLNVSSLTFKSGTNYTVLELTGAQVSLDSVDAGTYYVNIKGMKDSTVRANLLPEQTIEITSVDSNVPTVSNSFTTKSGTLTGADLGKDDTITFYFSEAMNVDTLNNLSNYVLNGTGALSAMNGVSVKSIAADSKSITITYPNARLFPALGAPGEKVFTVYALKDLAGNMVTTNLAVKNLGTLLVAPTAAKATATDKVVVTFATPIASVDPSAISVTKDGVAYALPIAATIGTGVNNNKVTFTLNKAMDTFTTGYAVVGNNVTLITDTYGQSLTAGTVINITGANLVDGISPVIDTVKVGATADKIVLTFSEPVTPGPNLNLDLVLNNITEDEIIPYTSYSTAQGAANEIVITLSDESVSADKVSVALINGRFVADGTANTATTFTAMTVKDGTNDALLSSSLEVTALAAVTAYENLALTSDALISTAVTSAAGAKEGSTAAVAALSAGTVKTSLTARIAAKDAAIVTANTIATVTVANVNITATAGTNVQVTAVAKNAAGVTLTTGVTYAWTTTLLLKLLLQLQLLLLLLT